MARYNAQRFRNQPEGPATKTSDLGPTSGVSPALRPTLPAPATSPPGRGVLSDVERARKFVRVARPQDLKFLSHLQKRFSNELGFLPTQALQWYVEHQRVGIVTENGEPAGYVLGRTHYKYQPLMRPITQTAIAMDAQRRHNGLALVDRVCKQAIDARQLVVQAICAEDLEANDFWAVAGFLPIGALPPNNSRGRELIIWRKQLISVLPDWFYTLPTAAGERRRRK